MSAEIPAGSIIKIELELRLPVAATREQLDQWLPYGLLQAGGCALDNPLLNEEPEEWRNSFEWTDTGYIGTREEFDHKQEADGSKTYRVRYRTKRRAA